MTVTALIPAYNAEHTITPLILDVQSYVDHVIVCDDGSTDRTLKILRLLRETQRLTVLRHEENRGKGAALHTLIDDGLQRESDVYVTLDADGQHKPCEIPRLTKPVLRGEADVAVGHRRYGDIPFMRRVGNRLLNMASRTTGDGQCGFRAYSRRGLNLVSGYEGEGFTVDSEILAEAKRKRLRMVRVPVSVTYNQWSHTRSPFSHFREVAAYFLYSQPLRILGVSGGAFFLAGCLLLLRGVYMWMKTKELAFGSLLIGGVGVMVGVTLFQSGLILHLMNRNERRGNL